MLETQREHVPDNDGGELDTALAFLNFVRSCLLKKLDGLDDEQQRRRLVVSETTLLGLVRHSIDGERYWFSYVVGGDERYAEVDFGMDVPDERTADDVVAAYRAAIADSDAAIRERGLDAQVARWDFENPKSVRWVLAHMTGETARHAGHADILRELIDGVTGR
ncbi:DinB family protein [Nocardioides marmorisolisilvae]|uniref:DinB family protein n=1 Tax=Nocardioides marmorisolisilvae TaxID=1542737 RepID=A0A3N0DZQ2_9ACTN|nr:DinB family protein [Nocardioides marmorisolisilvae]RNL80973.1 DinB family protein [Nocardioides marmorisolisilvae]